MARDRDRHSAERLDQPQSLRSAARLQRLSVHADCLLELLPEVRSKLEISDASLRKTELVAALAAARPRFEKKVKQIEDVLGEVEAEVVSDPEGELFLADSLTRLANEIEEIADAWPDGQDEVKAGEGLAAIESSLQNIRGYAGLMAVPTLLRVALRQISPGAAIDFHAQFAALLPREEDRRWVLDYLYRHPRRIDGLVDIDTGRVYRASSSASRRLRTLWYILLLALAGYGVLYGLTWVGKLMDFSRWPFEASRLRELLVAYTAALGGGVVHLVVDFIKQERSATQKFFWGISDWLLWIHVREGQFLRSVLSFLIVILGAAASIDEIDPLMAFFFGYSVDSMLDLIFQRFDKFVAAGSKRALALKG